MESKSLKGYLFLLPSLIGFAFLYFVPFILGIKYSFSNSGFDTTFVGFKNYIEIFQSFAFKTALKNTAIFMGVSIPLIIIISFTIALIIHEIKVPRFAKFFIILPIVIPSAAVAGFFKQIFGEGGLDLFTTKYAMLVVILIYIWKNTGYNLILYLAGLSQIDKGTIEASMIDGASYVKRLKHIIIPLTTPTTVFVAILSIINSFKVFKDVFILEGRYPNINIYMLQHYMTNKFREFNYEKLTSAAYIFSLVIFACAFCFIMIDRRHMKKVGEE